MRHARIVLVFLSGFALGVCALVVVADLLRRPEQPLGSVPRQRENVLVLKWLLDHRPDAEHLRFVAWWPPLPTRDNPFTHGPASLVHVVFTNDVPGDRGTEDLLFYVKDDQVLGAIPNGQGQTDPRAPLWTARSEPDPPARGRPLPFPMPGPTDVTGRRS
jgi:hypothetical protein